MLCVTSDVSFFRMVTPRLGCGQVVEQLAGTGRRLNLTPRSTHRKKTAIPGPLNFVSNLGSARQRQQ
jgi:hypothetical protein